MKMIIFFSFFLVMEHRWNEIDRGKLKYSGKKVVPVPLCPPQIPNSGLRGDRQATNLLSRGTTPFMGLGNTLNSRCRVIKKNEKDESRKHVNSIVGKFFTLNFKIF
jgi:hypothetical protein